MDICCDQQSVFVHAFGAEIAMRLDTSLLVVNGDGYFSFLFCLEIFSFFFEEIIIIFAWLCPFLPINFRLFIIKEISLCGLCYVAFRISGPFVHMSTVD